MSERHMEQKVDLGALESALARVGYAAHPLSAAAEAIVYGHNALPALIAELRELRARTTPEPIREKHRDGNWWLVWVPGFEHWLKCRFRHDQWMLSGPATAGLCDAPTHAVPMPPAPEEPNAEN